MTRWLDIDDPEFYVELLSSSSQRVKEQSPFDQHMPNRRTSIPNNDPQLSKRLRALLDLLASVIVKKPKNPAAMAASMSQDEVTIYFTFDTDEVGVEDYLNAILHLLRQVVQKEAASQGGSYKAGFDRLEELIEIVHNFCWESFAKRVRKGRLVLDEARKELDRSSTLSSITRRAYTLLLSKVSEVIQIFDECQALCKIDRQSARKLSMAYGALLVEKFVPNVHEKRHYKMLQMAEQQLREIVSTM
jgi:hypothetical protein